MERRRITTKEHRARLWQDHDIYRLYCCHFPGDLAGEWVGFSISRSPTFYCSHAKISAAWLNPQEELWEETKSSSLFSYGKYLQIPDCITFKKQKGKIKQGDCRSGCTCTGNKTRKRKIQNRHSPFIPSVSNFNYMRHSSIYKPLIHR